MRIVVHGQQAFGKAVLEELLKRGENVVAVLSRPRSRARQDPLKGALAAKLAGPSAGVLEEARGVGRSRRSTPTCR